MSDLARLALALAMIVIAQPLQLIVQDAPGHLFAFALSVAGGWLAGAPLYRLLHRIEDRRP